MSSYPAVGSALSLWVFFINYRVTALCPDPLTLPGPGGGLHWPGRKRRVIYETIRNRHDDGIPISKALYN